MMGKAKWHERRKAGHNENEKHALIFAGICGGGSALRLWLPNEYQGPGGIPAVWN
jgi:hypothetical protein